MSYNLYSSLRALFPAARLQVGTVSAVDAGAVTITLPDGGITVARGAAQVGERVYVRDGLIEGPAPDLPIVEIEV